VKQISTSHPHDPREGDEARPVRQRRRSLWGDFQWTLLSVSALATIALGVAGFLKSFGSPGETVSLSVIAMRWLDALYRSLQLFVLEFDHSAHGALPWELQVARFAAPAISVFAAVKALLLVFQDHVDLLRVRLWKDHVIVCGIGEKGLFLVEAFRRMGHRVVAIDRDRDNPRLALCRDAGSPVLTGDSTHPDILKRAGVRRAGWLIAVMGTDSDNAEAAVQTRRLVRRRDSGPLTCVAQVDDPALWMLLREEEFRTRRHDDLVRLEFFNVFETAARVMLDRFPPFPIGTGRPVHRPHLVFVGLGRMGRSALTRAALHWRLRGRGADSRPLVTVLDLDAEAKLDLMRTTHPQLSETIDIDCRQADVRSPEFVQTFGELSKADTADVSAVYVCLGDDSLSLVAALAIQLRLRQQGRSVPIVARVTQEVGLARLLPGGGADAAGDVGVRPFGLMDRACSMELVTGGITETIARALHTVYLGTEGLRGPTEGDRPALRPWEDLPEHLKEQNREQADSIARQIETEGFRVAPLVDWDAWDLHFPDDVVERLARSEHDRWLRRAKRSGYRRGDLRDERKKRTPSLVDWADLPEPEREKDREFVRRWPETLYRAGLQIEKDDASGERR